MSAKPHLLHVFSTFRAAGPQVRTVAIMNYLGAAARHSVMALDGDTGAASRVASDVPFDLLPPPSVRSSLRNPFFFRALLGRLRPNLLLTYNWGAIDAVMAAALWRGAPALHGEDGFGADEAVRLMPRRVWTRRLVLPLIHATVVPSMRLHDIATRQYRLRESKVRYIPNGVDTERFAPADGAALRRRLGIPADALVFGYTGRLGAEKNLALALRGIRNGAPESAWALLVGGGETRPALEALARELGMAHRTVFTGAVEDTAPYYSAMDVFAMSSTTEQMPLSLIEAMSAALPVVATTVGDTARILGADGSATLAASGDEAAYTAAVRALCAGPELRREMGARNRRRALAEYSLGKMLEAYRRLYESAYR